jgi:polyisoprenoid-binding protein YceI
VRGKFNHISGVIALDPDAGSGRMDVGLAADAIVTGDATLDRVLSGPEWFNADQFPSVRFVGDKFVFAEGRLHQVDGKLTLLGVTQPVTLTIQRTGCAKNFFTLFRNVCGADATTRISRSAFGLTRYASLIADEVEVSIAVEGVVAGKQGSSDSEAR